MFAKLFLVDKSTIIGIFTVVRNNHTNIEILSITYELLLIGINKIEKAKGIQEIGVDFKGI